MPSAEGAPSKVKLIVSSDGDVTDDFIESLFRQREVDYALRQHQSGLERQGVAHFPARSRAARLLQRPSSSSSSIERKDYLRRSYDINPYSKPKQQLQPAAGPRAVRGRAPVRASTGARVSSADGHSRGVLDSTFDVQCHVVNRALNLRLAGKNRAIEALEARNRQLTDKLYQLNRQLAQEQERSKSLGGELSRCRTNIRQASAEQSKASDEADVDLELLKEQLLDFHETIIDQKEKAAQSKQRYSSLKTYANQLRADYEAVVKDAEASREIADKLAPRVRALQVANAKLVVDLHTKTLSASEDEGELAELRLRLQEAEEQLLSSALDADRLREALRGYRLSASRKWQKEALNSPSR